MIFLELNGKSRVRVGPGALNAMSQKTGRRAVPSDQDCGRKVPNG